jgi:hypothetical protein
MNECRLIKRYCIIDKRELTSSPSTLLGFATMHRLNVRSALRGASRNALSSARSSSTLLPAVDKVLRAPFMTQVKFGRAVSDGLLNSDPAANAESIRPVLSAMLATSDGKRGFFVSYLTSSSASSTSLPPLLKEELASAPEKADLIELSIMNVIMPTAQATFFDQQAALGKESDIMSGSNVSMAKTSRQTALRALPILSEVTLLHPTEATKQIDALKRASTTEPSSTDDALVARWRNFFVKWGYNNEQLQSLNRVISDF